MLSSAVEERTTGAKMARWHLRFCFLSLQDLGCHCFADGLALNTLGDFSSLGHGIHWAQHAGGARCMPEVPFHSPADATHINTLWVLQSWILDGGSARIDCKMMFGWLLPAQSLPIKRCGVDCPFLLCIQCLHECCLQVPDEIVRCAPLQWYKMTAVSVGLHQIISAVG